MARWPQHRHPEARPWRPRSRAFSSLKTNPASPTRCNTRCAPRASSRTGWPPARKRWRSRDRLDAARARCRPFRLARHQARAAGRVWRAHHARHRRRCAQFGDVRRRADPRRRTHHRRRECGQAGAKLRPVRRRGAAQDAAGGGDFGRRGAAADGYFVGLAGAPLRPDRRLRGLRAFAALTRFAAPGPARDRRPRCRLRRDARCPGRAQLRGRLRADADARVEEPAVGNSRRGRVAARADAQRRPST